MAKNNTRKCFICKQEFDINNTEYLKDKSKYIERQCYIDKHLNKGLSIEIVNEKINIIEESMRIEDELKMEKELEKERRKLEAKQNEINRSKNKDDLITYIMNQYDITSLPKTFYIKLASINNGTHKGMSEGISYEDLLFIFKRKQTYLNSVNNRNMSIGKNIKGVGRVNYDLAIIIGMYDEYKEWKRKKSILQSNEEVQKEESNNTINIDFSKINSVKSNNEEDDILDILDDIY